VEMSGEQHIPLPQQRVWEALNNPAVLKECIAGCESIDKVSDEEFKLVMLAAVGPVRAKFTGKLLLRDLKPPDSYELLFEGSGGSAGFGKGSAKVALTSEASGTRLAYQVHASVGGKLAQVGSRLIDGVARKMADDFFTKFKKTQSPSVEVLFAPQDSLSPGRSPAMWVIIIGAVIVLLTALLLATAP
jgi:uncharacterized protein